MGSKVEQAVSYFQKGFSCSQSIVASYCTEFGLNERIALKLATGFGGGMGRLGKTCGAVTGALMVIGLKYGRDKIEEEALKEKTYTLVQKFINKFINLNKAISCNELLECDISTLEGLNSAKEKNLFSTLCPNFVRTSAELLEKIL